MDHFGEQPRFEVQPVIEQKPFESLAVQSFFSKLFEISDSIHPQIISRDDWKQRGIKDILEKSLDGTQTLYIPPDLQLWEFDSLPQNIKDSFLHWHDGETTLLEVLGIEQLKAELEVVRESGSLTRISAKERKIADKIQRAVSGFPYEVGANNPTEMVANRYINCVGASMLGGALMEEAGLNYLVGEVPGHSILFLVTSDDHVEWTDMLKPLFNEHLTDEMIDGHKTDGSPLTIANIVAFSKNPIPEGLMFDIKGKKYRKKLPWVSEGQRQYVTVYDPEYGHHLQLLNNTGYVLLNLGRYDEAIEAYRKVIAIDPKHALSHYGLGNALSGLGRYDEAIEAYHKAIAVNSEEPYFYQELGKALLSLGRREEANEASQRAFNLFIKQGI